MGYTKPAETTKHFLENSPLPNHGNTYTVISHKDVIKHTHDLLTSNGFEIERELYRSNMNAQVAQGIYHIKSTLAPSTDNDIGMMFAWTNSYDKSTRFQCAIGGYVFVCYNGLVSGDMANFARKHTGSADIDVQLQISSQIKHAGKFFKNLLVDKDNLKSIDLPIKDQAELLGRLFVDEKLLDATQISCVKNEIEKPSYNYDADIENAWTFYNHVTLALKKSHPRSWMSDQYKFHEFMTAQVFSAAGIQSTDVNNPDSVLIDSSEPTTAVETVIEEKIAKDEQAISEICDDDGETYSEQEARIQQASKVPEDDGFDVINFDDDTDEVIIDEEEENKSHF